jgi:Zn-dependent protease/CBS domain-containing protein
MGWSLRIGTLFGTEVRVHATFALLILWIALAALMAGGPAAALVNVGFVLALFLCVLAHEFGHVLTARHFGISTPDITLLPIGGMARLERMPEAPGQEIAVALAGPAVNVVIWAALTLGLGAEARLDSLAAIDDPAAGFWARLASVNLFLALFNLLPAFPMDGGRVLRAALAAVTERPRATRIAARTGQGLAFVLGLAGLMAGNPLLVLIGVFVFIAAGAENADVALQEAARDLLARDAMITRFEALAPDDSLEAAAAALIRTTQHEFPVLDPQRQPLGILTRQALFAALRGSGGGAGGGAGGQVSDVMTPGLPVVGLRAPLMQALAPLRAAAPAVGVLDADGRLLGYITAENIGEMMILRTGASRPAARHERT